MRKFIGLFCAMALAGSAFADFEVYFMRHGETPWNRAKVLQGSVSEIDLTPVGVAMAEETAAALARDGIVFDRVYTSPYLRARHTAEIPDNHESVKFVVRPMNAWGKAGEPIESKPDAYWAKGALYSF